LLELLGFKAAWSGFWKGLMAVLLPILVTTWAVVRRYPWPLVTVLALATYALLVHLLRIPQYSRSTLQIDGLCSDQWPSDDFYSPVVVNVRQDQTPIPSTAKSTTARIEFVHANGTRFTLTQAPWIIRRNSGTTLSHSIASSVDLEPNETQPFVFLMRRKDNRSLWVYGGTLSIPVGILSEGDWRAECTVVSDNAKPSKKTVTFTVYRDHSIRWADPGIAPPSQI